MTEQNSLLERLLGEAEQIEQEVRGGELVLSVPVSSEHDQPLSSLNENSKSVNYIILF